MQFKYNINHYLSLLPAEVNIEDIQDRLEKCHGISPVQFSIDRFIELSSSDVVPQWRLDQYATVLGVKKEQLVAGSKHPIKYPE